MFRLTRASRVYGLVYGFVCFLACLALPLQAVRAQLPPGTQSGDLIFRAGTEPVSDAVMLVDRDSEFSHVGMLVRGTDSVKTAGKTAEQNTWYVIHAVPSEVAGRADGVVMDTLDFFIAPARAKHYAVYRVQASAAQREHARQQAHQALGRSFSFGDDYTQDTKGTYCTVLVWHIWQTAGVDLAVPFTRLAIPFKSGQYLLPGALQGSARLQRLTMPLTAPLADAASTLAAAGAR